MLVVCSDSKENKNIKMIECKVFYKLNVYLFENFPYIIPTHRKSKYVLCKGLFCVGLAAVVDFVAVDFVRSGTCVFDFFLDRVETLFDLIQRTAQSLFDQVEFLRYQ